VVGAQFPALTRFGLPPRMPSRVPPRLPSLTTAQECTLESTPEGRLEGISGHVDPGGAGQDLAEGPSLRAWQRLWQHDTFTSMSETRSQLVGAFTGYHGGAIFQLTNGQTWQQRHYEYEYTYAYRPMARLYQEGDGWFMAFDCMRQPIEVVSVNILEEGTIISDFKGFDRSSRFQFQNGREWIQAEYKYNYYYAYRPHAIVVDGINGTALYVDGMNDSVRVKRA
jgi:hypothetical protein